MQVYNFYKTKRFSEFNFSNENIISRSDVQVLSKYAFNHDHLEIVTYDKYKLAI